MLILVGVTVTVAINGGLFGKAREGAKGTEIAREKEELAIAVASAYDVSTGKINQEELEKALNGWKVEKEEEKYIVTSPNKNIYEISEDGTITYIGVEESVTALEDDNNELTIGAIEDLVDLAIAVNNGTTYEGQTITLLTSLDFNNEDSYRTQNPKTTVYTDNGTEIDINGDGTAEPIMKELTEGLGFKPIGNTDMENGGGILFKGSFEGNGKTISNLYINRPEGIASLFGGIGVNTTIQNLTLKKPKICGIYSTGLAVSADLEGQEIDILTIKNCNTKGGKIGATNQNCTSKFSAGLIYGRSMGQIKIMNCKNESAISGGESVGIANVIALNKITVDNCSNYGKIFIEDYEYSNHSEDSSNLVVGCAIVCSNGILSEISDCVNNGTITAGVDDKIVGIVTGENISVNNCTNYGTLNGEDLAHVYGVCRRGYADMEIELDSEVYDSKNFGEINIIYKNPYPYRSGVAGVAAGMNSVVNCQNYGYISSEGTAKGNASGIAYDCLNVTDSINYGKVNGGVAGILEANEDLDYVSVTNCANYGDIINGGEVSGLVYIDWVYGSDMEVKITNSYNSGNLSGRREICGICYDGTIKNCYNLGNLTGIGQVDGRTHYCSYYFERNPNKLS